MRLTKKYINGYASKNNACVPIDYVEIAKKLGQLEDIEEELGIDFITLFKALENVIYVKYGRLIKKAKMTNVDIKH